MEFCPRCKKGVEITARRRKETIDFHGKKKEIIITDYYCKECGEPVAPRDYYERLIEEIIAQSGEM